MTKRPSPLFFFAEQAIQAKNIAEMDFNLLPRHYRIIDGRDSIIGFRRVQVFVADTAPRRRDYAEIMERLRMQQCVVWEMQDWGRVKPEDA